MFSSNAVQTMAIVLLAIAPCLADDTAEGLAKRLPSHANTVMFINLQTLRASPIAQSEGWASGQGQVKSGLIFLPQGSLMALGAQTDFGMLKPLWTAGLLVSDQQPSVQALNGTIDRVGGHDVIETAHDMYVLRLDDQHTAAYIPASRQDLAKWMAQMDGGASDATPGFVVEAAKTLSGGADLVLAVDLQYVVSESAVEARAKESFLLIDKGIDADKFAQTVSSVQSAQISATLKNDIAGQIVVHFSSDVQALAPIAKQLVLEVIKNSGVHLDDLDLWTAAVDGNSMTLSGNLSTASLRRIMSFMDSPAQHLTSGGDSSDAPQGSAGAVTKKYFDAVTSLIDDLRKDYGQGEYGYTKNSTWCDKYANQIDNLAIRGVDPAALDFGNFVSQSLRNASLGMVQTRENRNVRDQNLTATAANWPADRWRRYGYYGYGYGYGNYGYRAGGDDEMYRHAETEDHRAIHQQDHSLAVDSMTAMFEEIANRQRDLRRQLADAYPEFGN